MMTNYLKRTRRSNAGSQERRGVAAVEFAIVAPVMFLLTFGMIEVGSIMMIKNSVTQASRIGARTASLPNSTNATVESRISQELQLMNLTTAVVELSPANVTQVPPGGNVSVTVRINPTSVTWLPRFLGLNLAEISAQATMRRETTQ
jgi:Flp pilus assembly protein TadG